MQLRTKLCLTTSVAVLVLFGGSEYVSFRQTADFLAEHEAILENADAQTALATLRAERGKLFHEITSARLVCAGLTIAVAVVILNALWFKLVLKPLRLLAHHVDVMKRGRWTYPIPMQRQDEFGDIVRVFNELGAALTLTVHQYASASKLAALSLIGQRLVRRTKLAADHVESAVMLLGVARDHQRPAPDRAIRNLELTAKDLRLLQTDFDDEFRKECQNQERNAPRHLSVG